MDKIKIIHAADLHFDTPFQDVSKEQSNINREELKEVFLNIINFAKENSVDILLLAGDIFDNFTVSRQTLHFLENCFDKIKNTRIFISPGNHDPYGQNSFYKLINFPSNVHIFKGKIEKVYIKELNLNVWGAGFNDKFVRDSLLNTPQYSKEQINIMVMHGDVTSGTSDYNPIRLEQIKTSGMDYIALGHVHGFSNIKKEGNTSYAYSGCPQGRGFDELNDKGIIYGYVYKGSTDLSFVKTSKREYIQTSVDITDVFGYNELREKIVQSIEGESRETNFHKIILTGEISSDFNIDLNIINQKLSADFYYCKVVDKTTIKYDLEELSKGYSVKSIFVKKMREKIEKEENEDQKEILNLAFKLGILSLSDGGDVNLYDNQTN